MKIKLSKSQWDFIGKQANWARTKWEGSTGEENASIAKRNFDKNSLEIIRRNVVVVLCRNKIETVDLEMTYCDKSKMDISFGYKVRIDPTSRDSVTKKIDKTKEKMEILKKEIVELMKEKYMVENSFKVNINVSIIAIY